jgi:hypothetical protein
LKLFQEWGEEKIKENGRGGEKKPIKIDSSMMMQHKNINLGAGKWLKW